MTEGIDLAYERATWQVIAKVSYPTLIDPAVYAKFQQDPDWYQWQAIRGVLQAAGRVCRSKDDFGVTYVIDSAFRRLYEDQPDLFPDWFKEAVVFL